MIFKKQAEISIHAPTRGATRRLMVSLQIARISIHAPTRGATEIGKAQETGEVDFNPRSHKGSDGSWPYSLTWTWYFNPRSHKGSDGFVFPGPVFQVISIHAPTRGATFPDGRSGRISLISIHAPTRGATPMCKSLTQTINISIHAPTRGATQYVNHVYSKW